MYPDNNKFDNVSTGANNVNETLTWLGGCGDESGAMRWIREGSSGEVLDQDSPLWFPAHGRFVQKETMFEGDLFEGDMYVQT